jgi:glutathione S-transferase
MSAINRDVYYRFYAAELSYFSAKVRPALRYKRIPFVELMPTTQAYREVIEPRTGLRFIPVVITDDDTTLQDTSDILDELERRFPDPPLYPTTPVQRVFTLLWELYADEFLIIPGLHYRWSFPESEAKARSEFAAFTGDGKRADKFADQVKFFTRLVGVLPETIPHIEAHTRNLLDLLSAHFAAHPYLLGQRPSLADCALMGPLYAHLYMDAVPGRLLRETAPRVCQWIERMNHPEPGAFGDWAPDDRLPDTLRPLLDLVGRDAVPLLLDTVRAFESWADTRPTDTDEPPRGTDMHSTQLRGVPFERFTSSYTLWMVQRPLDAYGGLADSARRAVDAAIAGTECEALFAYAPRHRLGKRKFKLVFESETPSA